jgi:hypothetical protein
VPALVRYRRVSGSLDPSDMSKGGVMSARTAITALGAAIAALACATAIPAASTQSGRQMFLQAGSAVPRVEESIVVTRRAHGQQALRTGSPQPGWSRAGRRRVGHAKVALRQA